jgi:hypothetical protein
MLSTRAPEEKTIIGATLTESTKGRVRRAATFEGKTLVFPIGCNPAPNAVRRMNVEPSLCGRRLNTAALVRLRHEPIRRNKYIGEAGRHAL